MGKSLNPKLRESQFFSPGRTGPVPIPNGASRGVRVLGFRVWGFRVFRVFRAFRAFRVLGFWSFTGIRDSALPSRLGSPVVSFCPFSGWVPLLKPNN